MREKLKVAVLGNAIPSWSTENEYLDAFERAGHLPVHFQEGEKEAISALCEDVRWDRSGFDLVVWIRTPQLAKAMGDEIQWRLIAECRRRRIPIVGVHLDRWWDLDREHMIFEDPYFRVDLLCTADGGHQDEWAAAGVRHRWLLPAISERWCQPGNVVKELECDVLFVGSWKHYHKEWDHRYAMVQQLSRVYGNRFHVAPRNGQPRVHGLALNDLYWSAKVVVGDSCLVPLADGSPMVNYCSDRIPETLGRGGFLVHPFVEGITDTADTEGAFNHEWWCLGDWDGLRAAVERMIRLADDPEADDYRRHAIGSITERHTYTHRVNELVEILEQEGLL